MNKSKKEADSGKKTLNPIQYFFIVICAGANKEIIEECPIEWSKYTSIGAAIFFTGLLASISGSYALYSIFQNSYYALLAAIPFGLLWGLVIFNIDRLIVSTFRKSEEFTFKEGFKVFFQLLLRISLAFVIAITISVPLEIRIFKDSLAYIIVEKEQEAEEKNKNHYEKTHGINTISRKVNDKREEIEKKMSDKDKMIGILYNEYYDTMEKQKEITKRNESKIKTNRYNAESLRSQRKKNNIDINNYKNSEDDFSNKIDSLNKKNDTLSYRINLLDNDSSKLAKEIESENNKHQRAKEKLSKYNDTKEKESQEDRLILTELEKEEITVQDSVKKDTKEAKIKAKDSFSNSFITQLEALGSLKKKDETETMWWTSLMIKLLFLAIELMPIFTKLITKRSAYDELFDLKEYEHKIYKDTIKSQIDSEYNNHTEKNKELTIKIVEAKNQKVLEINKNILNDIAKKQEELALKAIKEWYKAQKVQLQ